MGPRREHICLNCGKSVFLQPYRVAGFRYCSNRCKAQHHTGEQGFNWRGGSTERICEHCNKRFQVKRSTVSQRHYCSKQCHDIARMKRTNILCPTCGRVHSRRDSDIECRHIYCNVECSRISSLRRTKTFCIVCDKEYETRIDLLHKGRKCCSNQCASISRRRQIVKTCKYCGKEFSRPASRNDRKFCSRKCSGAYVTAERDAQFGDRPRSRKYPPRFNHKFKTMIRERDDHRCALCGRFAKDVHHVNYLKLDTRPDNCITLCRRCNNLVNYNRPYWQAKIDAMLRSRID